MGKRGWAEEEGRGGNKAVFEKSHEVFLSANDLMEI